MALSASTSVWSDATCTHILSHTREKLRDILTASRVDSPVPQDSNVKRELWRKVRSSTYPPARACRRRVGWAHAPLPPTLMLARVVARQCCRVLPSVAACSFVLAPECVALCSDPHAPRDGPECAATLMLALSSYTPLCSFFSPFPSARRSYCRDSRRSYCRDSLSFVCPSLFRLGNVRAYLDTWIPVYLYTCWLCRGSAWHYEMQAVMMCSMGPMSAITRADIHTMLSTPSTRAMLLSAMQVPAP